MTPETRLKNAIMLEAGKRGFVCLRLNSGRAWNGKASTHNGKVTVSDARPIALCPEGTSDMLFIMPNGRYCFVESKIKPRKPTQAQLSFISRIHELGGLAGVCYSVDEFVKLVTEEKEIYK